MNFIDELRWRGMFNDATPGVEEHLLEKMRVGYIGFDPTAPALTIGNYVQIMILKLFQLAGHKPIIIMGGATGRIGDPSGKDKERELKSFDELDGNLDNQMVYFRKFLDFEEGEKKAEFRNNLDIYSNMNVLDFLRDVGKSLTVNYMMSKTSVKKRVETGLSFTEFSYQLIQGYDFQWLYENDDVTIQMGGSDQWGNITTGTEFIGKNVEGGKAYAVTTPLLTKSDGSKFGKSESGNIWLDPKMTSPYKFYQFWINGADDDITKFNRYFSLKSREAIKALEANHAENPNAMKKALAEELVVRVHGQEAYESVAKVSGLLFNKKASKEYLMGLSSDELATVADEIPSFQIAHADLGATVNVVDLITAHATILSSKGEAKRAIKGNALSINKEKVNSDDFTVSKSDWLHDKYLMVENGKKNKYILSLN